MRIPSGVTDQYIYFVAVDPTDFTTRETGLTSFTVYRSRNGGAAAAMTTPTINETDVTNMPGVYELLLDEDMTIDAGDDSQEMVFHITQASMAPVTRTIELYRPKITAGNTLTVASDGDLTEVNTLTGHTAQTGDSFARLGAPAGASVSADIATVDANVDTLLTRITSTLFSGITSLAEWLGLIAGKQTGDATARTEIRATGAGSGTYDETTDSNEAIRDTAPLGTAMRGTDNALLATSAPANFSSLGIEADGDLTKVNTAIVPAIAGVPGTLIVEDTFTDTNGTNLTAHTMDTGAGWTVPTGALEIQSNAAVQTTQPGPSVARISTGQTDYIVQADLRGIYESDSSYENASIIVRRNASNDYWQIDLDVKGQRVLVEQWTAGGFTANHTWYPYTFVSGTAYTFKVRCFEDFFSVEVDGQLLLTEYHSFANDGQSVGFFLGGLGTPATKATVDNFTARDYTLSVLEAADVRTAVGLATANLDTQLATIEAVTTAINSIDGKTAQQALQYIAAICAGKVSGAGSGTETFVGLDGVTNRAAVTVDASGNRTSVSYDP